MKHVATITSKGQITIPQEVRRRLGLKQGDRVSFELEDGNTVLKPHHSSENPFEAFAGVLESFETKDDVNAWLSDLRE